MMAPDATKLQTHKEFYDAGSTPARRIEKDEFESLGATRLRSRASHLRSLNFAGIYSKVQVYVFTITQKLARNHAFDSRK